MGNLPQRLLLGLLEWGSPKVIELIKKGWIKTADDLEKLEPEDLLVLKNLRDQKVLSSAKNKVTALPKEKSATEDIVDIFEEDIVQVPIDRSSYNLSRYEKAKARINPADKKLWRAKSLEDKQKHLLEQYELIATGQKTKKEVAEELGYVLHNFSTIEQAAKLKYKKWLETRPKDIFSQEFKIKSTDQSKSKRIDKTTGYVMQVVSPRKKREMLEILENTKKLKPDDYKWGNDEFSLAFSQEYKKFFPDTFDEGLGGSNKFISDRDLAKQILDFQGSNLKLTPLPTTLRYDQSGDIFDITREGIQSSKAAWEQTPIGDITTGLASKYAKTQLLDLDGIWNAAKSSIYRDPMISDFLLPIRKNVAGGFDIDHITPIRFGGTNNKSNLRLIIKGSHLGETLSPDMTSVNAAVKNKSAMENDVFELSKEMINLVVNKEYKKALDIKQAIQTIVNNFKKTNPNTDFGIGMPHVVIKTGDNTASNVRLIDYLQLDDNTKKLIETDFIVYEKNLPNFGKSLQKTAEEVSQMYQPLIDAAGGELDTHIAKKLFERADGGFASIEEVLEY